MSGWWFAALAASATRLTNATAPLKPLKVKVFVSAAPSRVQPAPEARREASATSLSRVSFSGAGTPRAYLYAFRTRRVNLRYPDHTKLCEPTWLVERPVPPVTYAKTGATAVRLA